jgi:hypothetical protein
MNEMDRDLPSCLRALRHVYRRGPDWFQACHSLGLRSSSVLVHFVQWPHDWTKWPALFQFLMNEMDRDLLSCLRALRHVQRRGLDWFQQCQSLDLGCSSVLVHFAAWMHSWMKCRLYCDSSGRRWIGSSSLVCGYFGMPREEVSTGFNSVLPFFWVTHELLVHFTHGRMAGCNDQLIAIPHE